MNTRQRLRARTRRLPKTDGNGHAIYRYGDSGQSQQQQQGQPFERLVQHPKPENHDGEGKGRAQF